MRPDDIVVILVALVLLYVLIDQYTAAIREFRAARAAEKESNDAGQ